MNKKIIVILFGGSPVELPFEENVQAILNMYLPGQAGGKAVVKLLFGEKNPSGKLAETWMKTYKDVPFGAEFVQSKTELYKESIYVGYRYYDCLKEERVRYPFGYGLSYTQFEYSESNIEDLDTKVVLSCRIQNTGDVEGAEVMQLYVANPQSEVFKAVKELRAFTKVYLKPKESKQVILSFNKKDLAYYHPKIKDWVVENGEYQVFIGASSQDIRCVESFSITNQIEVKSPYDSQKLKHYFNPKELCKGSLQEFETLLGEKVNISENRDQKFTMESRLDEVKGSFVGKLFYQAVVGVGEKQYKRSEKLPEGAERDMQRKNGMFLMKMMPNNSIRSMSVSSSGRFKYNVAEGLINILNGRIIKGLKCILKKDKLPSLPKDKQ
jgi:beta-glucosidase